MVTCRCPPLGGVAAAQVLRLDLRPAAPARRQVRSAQTCRPRPLALLKDQLRPSHLTPTFTQLLLPLPMKLLLAFVLLLCALVGANASLRPSPPLSRLPMEVLAPQKTYVLVHGAFAGQYAWQDIKPRLEKAGAKVVVFDLPGHGDDHTAAQQASFESYVQSVVAQVNAQPGRVILVGHSMGGMVISQVAEQIPDKIEKLIYLSAYLPLNGQSLQDLSGAGDSESLIGPNLKLAPDYSTATLPDDVAQQVFAADCSEEVKKLVVARNKPEPLAPFQAKVMLTAANFGRLPKYYIHTLKDQGVGPALQKRMVAANGSVRKTYAIDSSHSPYFAKPAELANILLELR